MFKYGAFTIIPLGLLLLSGCAAPQPHASEPQPKPAAQTAARPLPPMSSNVTTQTPGYIALKEGDFVTSAREFRASNLKRPNSPYDELNLGASYQNQGRMDLAEPFYRQAMTHGHNMVPVETTMPWAKGHTVEEIACKNLAMGLKPASIEGTATPCQTTLVLALVAAPGPVAPVYRQTTYNTYFDFDKSDLTADGRQIMNDAVKEIRDNPGVRVTLVGKSSSLGSDTYNYELSHQRVNTVRDAMIAAGIPSSRIDIVWVGEQELAVPQAAGEREQLNRVVEGTIN